MAQIHHVCERTAKAHSCTADVSIERLYPPVINHEKETQHIKNVAKKYFGGHSTEELPVSIGEDFCYFLQEKPGAFFCLGTKRKENETLHSSTYDFNDKCLAAGAHFWLRLVEDRLGVTLLKS